MSQLTGFVIILLYVYLVDSAAGHNRRSYVHPDHTVRFQRVQNTASGDIYVLDQWSRIYRFTSNLEPVDHGSFSVSSTQTSADEQVFLLQPNSSQILACSVGSCGILSVGEPRSTTWTDLNQTVAANVFSRAGVPTLATVFTNGKKTLVYTASQVTGNDLPFLTSRRLSSISNFRDYEFTRNKEVIGTLTIHESKRSFHHIKPIFLQVLATQDRESRHHYGYLISLQSDTIPDRQGSGSFVTRVGRFCAEDPTLRSYTEFTIQCEHDFLYPIAITAALQEDGHGGGYLSVAFGRQAQDSWNVVRHEQGYSAMCIFPLAEINRRFDEAVQRCFEDRSRNSILWLAGSKNQCGNDKGHQFLKHLRSTDDESFKEQYCRTAWKDSMNGLVNGQTPLSATAVKWIDKPVDGLQLVPSPLKGPGLHTNPAGMYLLGDMLILQDQSVRSTRNLSWTKLDNIITSDLGSLRTVVSSDRSMYTVLQGNRIESIPVGCGMHTDCTACFTSSQKILGCGWCGNVCTTLGKCNGPWLTKKIACPVVVEPAPNTTNTTALARSAGPPVDQTTDAPTLLSTTSLQIICVSIAVVLLIFSIGLAYFYRKKPWMRKVFHIGSGPTAARHDGHGRNVNLRVLPPVPSDMSNFPPEDGSEDRKCRNLSPRMATVVNDMQMTNNGYGISAPLLPVLSIRTGSHSYVGSIVQSLGLERNVISSSHLTVGKRIGKGFGGLVYEGSLTTSEGSGTAERSMVAIKCLHDDHLESEEKIKAFLEECQVMVQLSHENVMRLIGIYLEDEHGELNPRLILPFMQNGDLHGYVSERPPLQSYVVLDYVIQIARGMRYLSNEVPSQRIVHRDLAARNCMLDGDMKVVIADFGLSRNVHQTPDLIYTATRSQSMPVRWLAPESFMNSEYSTKSDVWSFAIVIWELFEQGQSPYASVLRTREFVADLSSYLQQGNRLAKPNSCSVELYSLMERCWRLNPLERPDFEDIVPELANMRKLEAVDRDGYMQIIMY